MWLLSSFPLFSLYHPKYDLYLSLSQFGKRLVKALQRKLAEIIPLVV